MHGNTLTRAFRALGHVAGSPRDGARWVYDKLHRKSPLELALPWMSYKAIDFLNGQLVPGMRVFEWGGGGSTLFFLRKGCVVTTVESSDVWVRAIAREVDALAPSGTMEIRHVPAETGKDVDIERYAACIRDGAPWSIVVVDGLETSYLSRVDCIREAATAVKPGGCVVLDDAWRDTYRVVPDILRGWKRQIFRGLGPARYGVTQTDVYFAPLIS